MEKQTKFPYQFFVVTFAWSWLIWLPLVLAGQGILPISADFLPIIRMPLSILAAFGPAVGAFYCLRKFQGKGAVRQYLRGMLDFRLGWQAWLVPVIVLGVSTWLAWFLPELWGESRIAMYLPSVWVFPFYFVYVSLFEGGQEEIGWRGYILDPMEERLGPWLGNLALGAIWAVWHLPLFFIPGSSQSFMPFWGFLVYLIGNSWFFAWVRQASGKRLLAGIAAHGLSNAFVPLFPTLVMAAGVAQPRYWIWAGLAFFVGLVTTALRSRKPVFLVGRAEGQ